MQEIFKTKTIREFSFHFKQESIVMVYNGHAHIAFHSFNQKNKKNLESFGNSILQSREMSLDRVYRLARTYHVPSISTTAASIKPLPPKILVGNEGRKSRILW